MKLLTASIILALSPTISYAYPGVPLSTKVKITVEYDALAFKEAGLPIPSVNINHHNADALAPSPPELELPISISKPTPKTDTAYDFMGAIDFRPTVDKYWDHTVKLSIITKAQKDLFAAIKGVEDPELRQYLALTAYVESGFGRWGSGKDMQGSPRGPYQFNLPTAKKYGLVIGDTDNRNDTQASITAAIALKSVADLELAQEDIPQTAVWHYLRHQQGVSGLPTLHKVYIGERNKLKFVAWNGKTISTRRAVLRNLTKSLAFHPSVRGLSHADLANYFVQHWDYVMQKAEAAVEHMYAETKDMPTVPRDLAPPKEELRDSTIYTVEKGDTVFEIMRNSGVYWKDIIADNNMAKPYALSIGQELVLNYNK